MSSVTMDDDQSHDVTSDRGIGQFIVYTLILLFFIGAGLRWRSQQEVHGVRIVGLKYINEAEVRSVLDSTVVPRKMSDVHLNEIRLAVMRVPYVRNATVQRSSENEIEISIFERSPLALVLRANGGVQYLDDQAVVLPYRLLVGSISDVPILRGMERGNDIDSAAVRMACVLLTELQKTDAGMLFQDISELKYDGEKGIFSIETSADGSKILFGGFENHSEKINNLYSLLRYTHKQNDQGAASLIDVRWKQKVFVTRKS